MVELASAPQLFHTPDEVPYARLNMGTHHETWSLNQRMFKRWLCRLYFEEHGKVPRSQAVKDAIGVLEGQALFAGPQRDVHVRIAQDNDDIYLDLANDRWEVVRISPHGYEVSSEGPAFRRPKGLAPLPYPEAGGSLEDLRPFVNVGDNDWPLLLGALVAYLRPQGPYPITISLATRAPPSPPPPESCASSSTPTLPELRDRPRDVRDLMISATSGWIVAWDNLSSYQEWLSDAVCRLATGGGFATRELYSDDEEVLFDACRPVIVNGIGEIGTRGDYLDRSLLLYAPEISSYKRRDEKKFWKAFDALHPRIFGALLSAVSCALLRVDQVDLGALPRMADFAKWATAAEPALGLQRGAFMAAYASNLQAADEIVLEAAPVAAAVRDFVHQTKSCDLPWKGTATQLLELLSARVSEDTRRLKDWPKSASALGTVMRRIAPSLRGHQVEVGFERPAGKRRTIKLERVGKSPSLLSLPSSPSWTPVESQEEHDGTQDSSDLKQGPPDGNDGPMQAHSHSSEKSDKCFSCGAPVTPFGPTDKLPICGECGNGGF